MPTTAEARSSVVRSALLPPAPALVPGLDEQVHVLDEAPFLALGSGRGEVNEAELFLWVTKVVRLQDGRVVVADAGSSEVRIFQPTGAHQMTLGGRGEGPGEFPGLWSLWVVGDTLLVEDVFNGVHVFSAAGEFVRRLPPRVS